MWQRWDKWLYRGDGTFSDRTELRRPHYLDVDRKTVRDDEELKSLQTAIEVALVDGHGNDLCRLSKRPELNGQDSSWVLSEMESNPMFWYRGCHNFQAHPFESYELTLQITHPDYRANRIFITPTVFGGGIELPCEHRFFLPHSLARLWYPIVMNKDKASEVASYRFDQSPFGVRDCLT